MKTKPSNKNEQYSSYAKYSSLAIQMLFVIGVAIYSGLLLDNYLAFGFPLFVILFLFVAMGGIFFMLYRSIQEEDTE